MTVRFCASAFRQELIDDLITKLPVMSRAAEAVFSACDEQAVL